MRFWHNERQRDTISIIATVLLLLAGVVALAFLPTLVIDNRIERWVEGGGKDAGIYADFLHRFGSDEFVVVTYAGQPFFTEKMLDAQLSVVRDLENIPSVMSVQGIPVVFRDWFGMEDAEALQEDFLSTEFYRDIFISPDGKVAGLLIQTSPPDHPKGRRELVQHIRAAVEPLRGLGYEVHLAGPPLLNAVLDETSEDESKRVFPAAFCCSVLILLVLFRSIRATIVALTCSAWSVLLTMGLIAVSGRSLNMVSSAMPALLWVLSLSGMIHILWRYRELRHAFPTPRETMRRALHETATACILAALTTAFGFVSLGVSNMLPVRELGFFAAVGILLALAVNVTLGAWMTILLKVPGGNRSISDHAATVAAVFAVFLNRRARAIVILALVLIMVFLVSLKFVRVESDPLVFLPKDNPAVVDYTYVGEKLTGYYSLELILTLDGAWTEKRFWPEMESLCRELKAVPGVVRVLSPLDFVKKLRQWDNEFSPDFYALPETTEEAVKLIGELDAAGAGELRRLVDDTGRYVRLSVMINVMNSSSFGVITRKADALLSGLPEYMQGAMTGTVYQLVNAQSALVRSQLYSMVAAFFAIFLCILVGLRSLRLMLISILPNVFPILAAFAVMAVGGIALDPATVMMASVALGIAVDDTVHFLQGYTRARRTGLPPAGSVENSLHEVGPAMIVTSVTSCIGFFALIRSAFLPIAWFGILSGVAMVVALLADLFVGPALLLVIEGRKVSRDGK